MNIKITKSHNVVGRDVVVKCDNKKVLSIKTLNLILGVLKLEKIKSVEEYFCNIKNSLCGQNVDWIKFLSAKRKKEYSNYVKENIETNQLFVTDYFYNYFPERLALFKKLDAIDKCNPPIYKHSSTTGRLSIEKGVNYLVMKKDVRNKLQSPYRGHSLFELDFKSCEPNLYCRHFNLVPKETEDIYTYIASEINENFDNRDKLKRVILSTLYGASNNSIKKLSGLKTEKIKKVRQILNVDNFKNNLEKEYEENGFVKNMYGRPILSNANLVNYWIQSSAADYCCLAFNKFFDQHLDFKLHAVIHDAIIFSIPDDDIYALTQIKSLRYQNLSIPVKINKVEPHN